MLRTGLDEVAHIWTRLKSNVMDWSGLSPTGLDVVSIEFEFGQIWTGLKWNIVDCSDVG